MLPLIASVVITLATQQPVVIPTCCPITYNATKAIVERLL